PQSVGDRPLDLRAARGRLRPPPHQRRLLPPNDAVAADLLTEVTAGRATAVAAASPDRAARPASRDRAPRPTGPDRAASPDRVPRAPRIGILGPGKLGTAIARTALRGGLEVQIASRRHDEELPARLPGAAQARPRDLAA